MNSEVSRIGVIGSGSWATALVKILTDNGNQVMWWIRNAEKAEFIKSNRHNSDYLSSVEIHTDRVETTSDIQNTLNSCSTVVLAVPSAYIHQALQAATLPKNSIYISAIKGIEPHSQQVMAGYLNQVHGIPMDNIGIVTGPCHAEEVASEKLSFLTVAATKNEIAQSFADKLQTRYIQTRCNNDLIGSEYAAVMKNIYAIGAGIAHGLGYGDNYLALYVSAAIREMDAFLNALSPDHRDVKEAAYLGDLLVTCYSQFSRNRTFGTMLGKGYSVKSAQLEMNMVAEGYFAAKLVYNKCEECQIQSPIASAIYKIIYESANPSRQFKSLNQDYLG